MVCMWLVCSFERCMWFRETYVVNVVNVDKEHRHRSGRVAVWM